MNKKITKFLQITAIIVAVSMSVGAAVYWHLNKQEILGVINPYPQKRPLIDYWDELKQ